MTRETAHPARRRTRSRPRSARAWLAAACALALVIAACAALRWEPLGPRRVAPIAGAEPVGAEECGVCHEEVQGRERIAAYHGACESCHGGGSVHAESEEPGDIRYPANGDCLACHTLGRDTHLAWGSGEHSRAGLLCSDCHNPHRASRRHLRPPELAARARAAFPHLDEASGLCLRCHQDVAAELTWPSHHPVREGALGCLSCHNAHEDSRLRMGTGNDRCAACHQDYAGPWPFEHPPVVEGCTTCHAPHGAVAENLLETLQPAICLSCHTLNDTWHHTATGTGILDSTVITRDDPTAPSERVVRQEAQLFLDRCTDCHGAVHGSYSDEHLRH